MKFLTKTKKTLGLFAILSFAAFVMGNCRGHHDFAKRVEWVASKLTSKLDLDETQKTKLDQIKTEIIAKHKEVKPKHGELVAEVAKQVRLDKIDTKTLDKIGSDRDSQHVEMRKFFHTKLVEFHAVLRPEQREKLSELILKFGNKHSPEE